MAFPSIITSFSYPQPTDKLNSPSHSALENTQSSAIGQLQTFIGTDSSAMGTLTYDIRSTDSNGGGHIQSANKGGTGQTTFTKGDILVATSSSVITKFAIGPDNKVLTSDSTQAAGVRWAGGVVPSVLVYTSTVSLWTRPSNISYILVKVQGRGGTGASGTDGGANDYGGAGGGSGGYTERVIPFSSIPTAVSIVASNANSGLTVFGSLLQCTGGADGAAGSPSTPGAAGSVLAGGNTIVSGVRGGPSSGGGTGATTGGNGASAFLGIGGSGGQNDQVGTIGTGFGAGGGGGGGEGPAAGAAGSPAAVIIYEY